MKKHFALWLIAAAGLSSLSAAGTPASNAPVDLASALKATSPHPALGDQAQVLGRIVGTWDVEYTDFAKDGTATRRTGEFIVGWIMDGRALQDLWIVNLPGRARSARFFQATHAAGADERNLSKQHPRWIQFFCASGSVLPVIVCTRP